MHSLYSCDLAVSAVASDGGLVAELSSELAGRLPTAPEWIGADPLAGSPMNADDAEAPGLPLGAEYSRVVLVLHQHLWHHDARTLREAAALQIRVKARRGSVCVLALDDSPVAGWLADAPRYGLLASGRAGAAEFIAGVVAAEGGAVKPAPPAAPVDVGARWPDPPTPFLAQPRALAALRHELDGIVAVLNRELARECAASPDRSFDVHVLPHRVVARLDDVAISFSWLTTGLANVAEGRLLVMAWSGVDRGVRGVPPFKPANALRECVYAADGNAPDEWRWRADDVARQPYAREQLVADWLARACIARAG
ncbi:MAG TPA: hypothetical protein VHB25_06835 [Gemmatimonadaceae bacterium]|nr:hypothetical protein [Gemmatimonadaceae bacterium]